ncbi:hypothetical protein ACH4D5_16895 [Streptomyces sp. NPDC018029]|uniref:hypothetical protein n=1 Tax=Streptomyces sp. NPDC018029 TaxID=3365032 RepID=UPI0037ACA709
MAREADANPYNRGASHSPAHALHFRGSEFQVHMGSVQFTQTMRAGHRCDVVNVNEESLLSARIEGGHLLLSVTLRDEDGVDVVTILDNELRYALASWDVQFSGKTLTIRKGKGEILARISFHPPKIISIVKGNFLADGVALKVDERGISGSPGNRRLEGGIWGGTYKRGLVAWDENHSPGDEDSAFLLFPP